MTPLIEKLAEEFVATEGKNHQTYGWARAFTAGATAVLTHLAKEAGDEPTQDEIKDHAIEFLHRIGTTWGTEQAYRKGFEQASIRWAAKYLTAFQNFEAERDELKQKLAEAEAERDQYKSAARPYVNERCQELQTKLALAVEAAHAYANAMRVALEHGQFLDKSEVSRRIEQLLSKAKARETLEKISK